MSGFVRSIPLKDPLNTPETPPAYPTKTPRLPPAYPLKGGCL